MKKLRPPKVYAVEGVESNRLWRQRMDRMMQCIDADGVETITPDNFVCNCGPHSTPDSLILQPAAGLL